MQDSKQLSKLLELLLCIRCYEDAKISRTLSMILMRITSLILSRIYGNLQLFTSSFHRCLPWFLLSCTAILSWLWGKRRRILLRGHCQYRARGKQKNKMIILYHFITNKIFPLWPLKSCTYPCPFCPHHLLGPFCVPGPGIFRNGTILTWA